MRAREGDFMQISFPRSLVLGIAFCLGLGGCITTDLLDAGKRRDKFDHLEKASLTGKTVYLEYRVKALDTGYGSSMCPSDEAGLALVSRWAHLNLGDEQPEYGYDDGQIPVEIIVATQAVPIISLPASGSSPSAPFPSLLVDPGGGRMVLKAKFDGSVDEEKQLPTIPDLNEYTHRPWWYYPRYVILPLTVALDIATFFPGQLIWTVWICLPYIVGP